MDALARTEKALQAAVTRAEANGCPPRLAAAVRHAVFPRGARIRPRLCLAVANACGEDNPALAEAAGASLELLHCASLVHDDLPCFDDASVRRGKPSVHKAFGEPLAVLAGDAMIVMAFQTLAREFVAAPDRLAPVMLIVSRAVGMPTGIVAGQAWECEPDCVLEDYHRQKTGALFVAATLAGAAATGADLAPWQRLGDLIGASYQVADDIRDLVADAEELGKPVGQDALLGRPSAVAQLGLAGAIQRLEQLVREAVESIPDCPGAGELRALVLSEAKRLRPKKLAAQVAA